MVIKLPSLKFLNLRFNEFEGKIQRIRTWTRSSSTTTSSRWIYPITWELACLYARMELEDVALVEKGRKKMAWRWQEMCAEAAREGADERKRERTFLSF